MIVPMKKAQVVILKEDEKDLLKSLQKFGQFMLISNEETKSDDVSSEEVYLGRLQSIINVADTYRTNRKMFEFIDLNYSDFMMDNPKREELVNRIETIVNKMELLKQESDSYLEQSKAIAPFEGLDISLNKLGATRHVKFVLGFVNISKFSTLAEELKTFHIDYKLFGQSAEGTAILLVIHHDEYKEVMQLVRNADFNEITLPNVDMNVTELIKELYDKVVKNKQEYDKLVSELKEVSSGINELKILNDQISSMVEVKKAPTLKTQDTVYLEGWVRSDMLGEFRKAIEDVTNIYELNLEDPAEGEQPPTYTKNNEFVAPFESITNMFSIPSPNEIDPNPAMSWWYWFIFGMMMGDVGYGVVMFGLFYAFIKLIKPKGGTLKLVKVFMYSSISTIIWGILFGSYFGYELFAPLLVNPVNDPIKLMVISLALGGAHIITGLIIKMISNIKGGNVLDAIFDQLSWIFIIIGIGLMFMPDFSLVGQIVAVIGAALILIFGGRNQKNIIGKILGGTIGLYNITSYMSDILSYSRILALVLSSAVVGSVMNMLAGMVQGSVIGFFFSILIYIVGHAFNLAMGLLSAYVHDSRLQYIEFFGKFFEGGGYEFKPLSLNLKYINEINNDSKVKGEN